MGPFVYGDDRLGVWIIESANLTDKLKHVLPRLRNVHPITDVFLPESVTTAQKDQVKAAGYSQALYATANGRSAASLVATALSTHAGRGALELNIELPFDDQLSPYITEAVARVRLVRPNLALRINVAPFKGYRLPVSLFVDDPKLYVIAQAYYGNMDGRLSEADVLLDLLEYGIPPAKASIMYGAMAGQPRRFSLPDVTYRHLRRGSIYSDDLMMNAGLL